MCKAVQDQPNENHFLSPFSIESSLLLTLEGARGETAFELQAALALPSLQNETDGSMLVPLEPIRQELQQVVKQFERSQLPAENQSPDAPPHKSNQHYNFNAFVDGCGLRSSNGLWVEKTCPLREEYVSLVHQSYNAEIAPANFKNDAEGERERINSWISSRTNQKLNDFIPQNTLASTTRMVLANAVSFRGSWNIPFDAASTKLSTFHNFGSKQVSVPTMFARLGQARYAFFKANGARAEVESSAVPRCGEKGNASTAYQLLELDYQGGDYTMWLVLPNERNGLLGVLESLSGDTFDLWERTLQPRENVQLVLPKFKIHIEYDVRRQLEGWGVTAPFNPDVADFSGMSDGRLFMSKVIHRALLEIHEQGTEATAATVVLMGPTGAARQTNSILNFVVEHPFAVVIRHRPSGIILFIGVVQHLPG